MNASPVTAGLVWSWLGEVPDPEIPVISVVDLGIVRDVTVDDDGACVVTITPTYSGCPAMDVIAEDIDKALRTRGVDRLRIVTRLSPAWTTDWMSDAGKAALKGYGIAPPVQQVNQERRERRRQRPQPRRIEKAHRAPRLSPRASRNFATMSAGSSSRLARR